MNADKVTVRRDAFGWTVRVYDETTRQQVAIAAIDTFSALTGPRLFVFGGPTGEDVVGTYAITPDACIPQGGAS